MPESIASRSSTAVVWAVLGAAAKIAAQLLVQITLVRLLDPGAFGQFAVLMGILGLAALLTDRGLGSALIQKESVSRDDIGFVLGRTLTTGMLLGAIIFVAAPFISHLVENAALEPMVKVCALAAVIQAPMNLALNLMRRDLDVRRVQLIQVAAYVFAYGGVAISLATMGWGGWSLVLGFLGQLLVTLVAAYSVCGWVWPRWRGDANMQRFGLRSMASEFSLWCMETLDQLLVGKLWGMHALGLYTVALNLCRAPTGVLLFTLQNIAFSSTARLQHDRVALRKGFLAAFAATAIFTVPLFAMLSLESAAVLSLLYGEKWLVATPIMSAVATAIPLAALGSLSAAILRGSGAVAQELCAHLAAAVALCAGLVAMSALPLELVIWAVPLAYGLRFFALTLPLCKLLDLRAIALVLAIRGAMVLALSGALATRIAASMPGWAGEAFGMLPMAVGCSVMILLCLCRFPWIAGSALSEVLRGDFIRDRRIPVLNWLVRARP